MDGNCYRKKYKGWDRARYFHPTFMYDNCSFISCNRKSQSIYAFFSFRKKNGDAL